MYIKCYSHKSKVGHPDQAITAFGLPRDPCKNAKAVPTKRKPARVLPKVTGKRLRTCNRTEQEDHGRDQEKLHVNLLLAKLLPISSMMWLRPGGS
jgi:hypothetical protein